MYANNPQTQQRGTEFAIGPIGVMCVYYCGSDIVSVPSLLID